MDVNLVVALALAVLVGVSLGVLGGGGSILTTPILVYVLGMDPRVAIASSLFIVGVTSLTGLVAHARAGRVRWRTGLLFGAAGMVGAFAGGLVGGYLPGAVLMILFAAMMIATATAMIRGRRTKVRRSAVREATTRDAAPVRAGAGEAGVAPQASPGAAGRTGRGAEARAEVRASEAVGVRPEDQTEVPASVGAEDADGLPLARVLLDGFVVGLATGLVGAGGGFLVVPALALLGGLPMAAAVATSLLVIVMKSASGFAGYLVTTQIDWPTVLAFTGIAILGSLVGARLAGRLPERALRTGFGVFVLVMGVIVLVQEIPALLAGG